LNGTALQTLQQGLACEQQGRLEEAARLYSAVLEGDPGIADAWHLMGRIWLAERDFARARGCIAEAIQLRPDLSAYHTTLGDAFAAESRPREAELCYEEAVRLDPGFIAAWVNLGNLHQHEGRYEHACTAYTRALEADRGCAEAFSNLGNALRAMNREEEAIACYREAVRLRPEMPEAAVNLAAACLRAGLFEEAERWARRALELHPGLAEGFSNLSLALLAQQRTSEAEAPARQAITSAPAAAHLYANLASVLLHQKRWDEAEQECRRALEIQPDHPEARNNLGVILQATERLNEAAVQFERLLESQPCRADVWTNLGAVRSGQARHGVAMFCFDKALRSDPGLPKAHFCHALEVLAQGKLPEGFAEYEWRWKVVAPRKAHAGLPWDGRLLEGRSILLYAEQGLGDTIQFARYVPLVAARGGRVVVECQPAAAPIISSVDGVAEIVAPGWQEAEGIACEAPLMSLSRIFGTTLDSIPASVPYVSCDREAVREIEERLGRRKGLRVGLAWAGNPANAGDRRRSMPMDFLQPLGKISGVECISLHIGEREREEGAAAGGWMREVLSDSGGLGELAALMSCLDLVITVDTMTAHLAGALNRPVWTLLCASPDWRWMRKGETTPWYPSMRLYRQPRPGDWESVMQAVAAALRVFAIQDSSGRSDTRN